ncbi:MAG: glycosyltransferase family 4 protein [Thiohalocapsa sp.]
MQFLYISNGNIPSRWAHTVQSMKMCEAFSRLMPGFSLVTATDLKGLLGSKRRMFRWYGIERRFPVRRLVIARHCDPAMLQRPNLPVFAEHARRYVRRVKPRLVYTRNHQSALYALRDGFPVIFETHDGPGHPKTLPYIAQFAGFPNLRGIVTTSPVLRDAFIAEGIAPPKIAVHPNGVDPARFARRAMDRDAARRRLGLTTGRSLIVYTGSLQAYKGIGTLIAVAALLPALDVQLVGGTIDEIAAWRAERTIPKNLRFEPFVDNAELPLWLAASDICVVPNSSSDRTAGWTFSLKLYEYLAAGRPVVVSDIPSLRSVVSHGRDALLVRPDDPVALADAVSRLLTDPALAARLTEAGRNTVAPHTWERRAAAIIERLAPELQRRKCQ